MLNQLAKIPEIDVDEGKGPLINECEPCALAKMKEIVSRRPPTYPAEKPFKCLHFDLIIISKAFDGSVCLLYILDKKIRAGKVFPLSSKKQSEIIKTLYYMIYKAKRYYKLIVVSVRSDQEKGIGTDIENWVLGMGIEFTWSAVSIPSQNGRAERSGGVLTEKAYCIRLAANLPEDLWPECYLAANYLLCRTPTRALDWQSPIGAI